MPWRYVNDHRQRIGDTLPDNLTKLNTELNCGHHDDDDDESGKLGASQ